MSMVLVLLLQTRISILGSKSQSDARAVVLTSIRTHYCPANGLGPTDKSFGVWELRGDLGCRDLNGDWA
jgi:hypothetical protein